MKKSICWNFRFWINWILFKCKTLYPCQKHWNFAEHNSPPWISILAHFSSFKPKVIAFIELWTHLAIKSFVWQVYFSFLFLFYLFLLLGNLIVHQDEPLNHRHLFFIVSVMAGRTSDFYEFLMASVCWIFS